MPEYLKNDRHTFYISNQDAVLYPVYRDIETSGIGGTGLERTDGAAGRIYKGDAVLSENRSFYKKRAEAVSIITKGTKHKQADGTNSKRLSLHHDGFMSDMMHKVPMDIVRWCVERGVGTLVIGTNRGWKQAADMGKANNQSFGSVPHDMLRKMIAYKAANEGSIVIVEQEKSYTSKADISAMDRMSAYGKEEGILVFSWKRTSRGLHACRKGYAIDADCNGAANILRKAFTDAWEGTEDFNFLAYPETIGFRDLQRADRVKSAVSISDREL